MTRNWFAISSAVTVIAALTAPAHAYTLETAGLNKVRWQNNSATFERVTATFRPGDAAAITEAASLWNETPADFTFLTPNGDAGWGFPNGENEIARTTSSLVGSAPGICLYWFSPFTGHIVEADILINDSFAGNRHTTFKTWMSAYGGPRRALTSLMLHELGHGLGLKHEADLYNIMGEDWTHVTANGYDARPYPGVDAAFGAGVLYGFRSVNDVGVSHFAYDPIRTSGAYSSHRRTFVRDAMSRARPRATSSGVEPVYRVWPGSTVAVEFTYENLGSGPAPLNVQFYLSTDNNITTADTPLDSFSTFLSNASPKTMNRSVTIPSGVAPGDYFIGAMVTGPSGDTVAANNATYVGVDVANLWSECTAAAPCIHREGDCDSDAECVTGATCRHNVGSSYGATPSLDVCEYPLGHSAFCTGDASCGPGEGDCDNNSECLSGVCRQNVGASYGLPSWVDVCL